MLNIPLSKRFTVSLLPKTEILLGLKINEVLIYKQEDPENPEDHYLLSIGIGIAQIGILL